VEIAVFHCLPSRPFKHRLTPSLPSLSGKGTCVNVGCVPKKVMWNAATIAESLHDAKDYGFLHEPNAFKFDWSVIKQSRDAYIKRLNVRSRSKWLQFVLSRPCWFVLLPSHLCCCNSSFRMRFQYLKRLGSDGIVFWSVCWWEFVRVQIPGCLCEYVEW